jgi:hypothetical protein
MNFLNSCKYVGPTGRNGKLYQTTIGNFMMGRKTESVQKNLKNRKIDMKHVQSIVDNFDYNSFGDILAIEKPTKNGFILEQRSANHRCTALELMEIEQGGLGSTADLPLYIKLFPTEEALKIYVDEGNTKRLSVNDLLANTDYAFNNLLKTFLGIVDLNSYKGVSFFAEKSLTQIASVVYTMDLHKNYRDLSFKTVISNHKCIRELAGIPHGDSKFDIKLSAKNKTSLIEALEYATSVVRSLIDFGDLFEGTRKSASLSPAASKVLKCKTFFIFLVWDKLIEGSVTKIQAEKLARCLAVKDLDLIVNAINALNTKDTATFATEIYKIARTKTGYIRD